MSRNPKESMPLTHTPLHLLTAGHMMTAGRITWCDERAFTLSNAHADVRVCLEGVIGQVALEGGELVRVVGEWRAPVFFADHVEVVYAPAAPLPHASRVSMQPRGEQLAARALMKSRTTAFFERRSFLDVHTPCLVPEPGTDVYLEPFTARFIPEDEVVAHHAGGARSPRAFPMYLQTSPEFSMKRLLGQGFERIWQLTRGWRNGEVTARHVPEFTILEWYRAWEDVEAIMEDVEALTRLVLDGRAKLVVQGSTRHIDLSRAFERMTMQELVQRACGFDLLEALTYPELVACCMEQGLLTRAPLREPSPEEAVTQALEGVSEQMAAQAMDERWAMLFFELQVTHLDPLLEQLGAVFITHWPAPLAVLARRDPGDARVSQRFELYVGGLELANGFGELTDASEQRQRFGQDLTQRRKLGRPPYPMPERFLEMLAGGMPPSAGVAMGFDRLLMLATGAADIAQVCPFMLRRHPHSNGVEWGD